MVSRQPSSNTVLQNVLQRINATAEQIEQGADLFDPDALGTDLIRAAGALENALATLMELQGGSGPSTARTVDGEHWMSE